MQVSFWLKFYTQIIENKRLGALAFEDRWHFLVLYSLHQQASLKSNEKKCPPQVLKEKIATQLGLQFCELDKVKYRLMEAGLIDSEWNPEW